MQLSHLPSAEGFYPQNLFCTPKIEESMLLHIGGYKSKIAEQTYTSDSKPESDEGQTQQASTNPESKTGSDSALDISQMKLCSQFFFFFFFFCG